MRRRHETAGSDEWDGHAITATINPGPQGVPITKAEPNPEDGPCTSKPESERPESSRRKVQKSDMACSFVGRRLYPGQSERPVQDHQTILTLDDPDARETEIERILHLKSEIPKYQIALLEPRIVWLRRAICQSQLEISDLRCRIRPISKSPLA